MLKNTIALLAKLPNWIIGPMILIWTLSMMATPTAQALFIYTTIFTSVLLVINTARLRVIYQIAQVKTFQKALHSYFLVISIFLQVLGLGQIYIVSVNYPQWILLYLFFVLPLVMAMMQSHSLSKTLPRL
jgi:hypothetical protein